MSESSKRAVKIHFDDGENLNIYPSQNLKKTLREDAEDNLESMSKRALKIIKAHYDKNAPRKRSDLP